MKTNIGAFDGWFRILLFLTTLCWAIVSGSSIAWILVIPAAILFLTAVVMWCPLYEMTGINTSKIY